MLVGEGARLGPTELDRPDRLAFAQEGNGEGCALTIFDRQGAAFWELRRLGLKIGYVHGLPVKYGPSGDVPAHQWETSPQREGNRAVMRNHSVRFSVHLKQRCIVGSAEMDGALGECVQHRLEIRGRGADHPEDLGRRCLLLKRRRQVAVTRLELLEQAHILDGDDGLVGEGLQQGDLRVGERRRRGPGDGDRADRLPAP